MHRIGFRRRPLALAGVLTVGVWALLAALHSVSAFANVPLTQVSSDPYTNTTSFHATQVEPDTFGFGSTIVSAFQSGRFPDGGSSNVGWATSTDAGSSYSHGFLPGTTVYATPAGPYARVTDPSVAFDAKHGVWLINSLSLSSSVAGVGILVNRSTTGGLSWGNPVTVAAATGSENWDKNWIVCDNTATSPHYGSCYVQWDDFGNGNQLHMAFSRDGGLTWTQSRVPSGGVIGGQPVVQPSGRVIVPIDDASESTVESFVSNSGGASYTGPFSVATITSHTEAGNLRSGPLPTAEVDGAGRVYVAWSDCRFITSCTANDIVYSSSSNGTAWSAVKRIPIDAPKSGRDHFLPGLAVDRSTSGATAKLALTYYFYPKTNCTTTSCQLDVGFVSSANAGTSWTAPTQLAGPSSMKELPLTTQGYMVGDYLSTSYVTAPSGGDVALSAFAVGLPVSGKTCTLGNITSCNEPMMAPSAGLTASPFTTSAAATPVATTHGDHPIATVPLSSR